MIEPAQSRVHELFEMAACLPSEQQARFLEDQCGSDQPLRMQVEALLKWDAAAGPGFLQNSPTGVHDEMATSGVGAGTQIGAYTFLSPIGEGGMAVVWLATWATTLRGCSACRAFPSPSTSPAGPEGVGLHNPLTVRTLPRLFH